MSNNQVIDELNDLVIGVAFAYLDARGNEFEHLGVHLPLNAEVMILAIGNHIVGACLENGGSKQGLEDALLMLRHMLVGDDLTALGTLVLDEMNKAFCAEVRQMLNEGKDPMVELAKERRVMQ